MKKIEEMKDIWKLILSVEAVALATLLGIAGLANFTENTKKANATAKREEKQTKSELTDPVMMIHYNDLQGKPYIDPRNYLKQQNQRQ